jgi:hypothetical protein
MSGETLTFGSGSGDINLDVMETSTLMSGDIILNGWRHQP